MTLSQFNDMSPSYARDLCKRLPFSASRLATVLADASCKICLVEGELMECSAFQLSQLPWPAVQGYVSVKPSDSKVTAKSVFNFSRGYPQ